MEKRFLHIIIFFSLFIIINTRDLLCGENEGKSEQISFSTDEEEKYYPTAQTNPELNIHNYLNGINSAIVLTDEKFEDAISSDDQYFSKYYKMVKSYLTDIGIKNIAITVDEQNWLDENIPLEQTTTVKLNVDNTKNYISRFSLIFKTCNHDEFVFHKHMDYYIDKNWNETFLNTLKKIYFFKNEYNPSASLKLNRVLTNWNTANLEKYLIKNSIDRFEGIYEKYGISHSGFSKYKIALVKENESFKIIYLDGAINKNWIEGELKGTINKTSVKDFYKVNWIMSDKSKNENVYLSTTTNNILEFDFLDTEYNQKVKYLKMFPYASNSLSTSSNYISSGTGFLIANNGLIVTNQHIINNKKNIEIELKQNGVLKKYKAKKVLDDRRNDITILKIVDSKFKSDQQISYNISSEEIPLGTSVFTLGYPMIETMGEQIKLSDGIISSDHGYMSDSTTYQLTAPINPGNSGGPLFDMKGNLVGIINAKYSGAENVTYAIKARYLINLLEKNNLVDHKKYSNQLKELSFVEQVDNLDNLVCLIKVY